MSIPQSGGGPIESFAQLAEFMESGNKPEWMVLIELGLPAGLLSALPAAGGAAAPASVAARSPTLAPAAA